MLRILPSVTSPQIIQQPQLLGTHSDDSRATPTDGLHEKNGGLHELLSTNVDSHVTMADRDVDVVTKVRVTWKHLVEIADMLACRAVTVDDKQRVENENKHETAEWRHGGTACDDDKEAGGCDGTKSDEKSK